MNFSAPAPTLLSTALSLFRKSTPQPTFTPAAPPLGTGPATQVFVTRDTTTHVDPPAGEKHIPRLSLHCTPSSASAEKQYPDTPRAPHPHRTTFALPIHDWNTAEFLGGERYRDGDSDRGSSIDIDVPPGHTLVCHPTQPGVYAVAEPKTLARVLFFFGFLFPPFWIAGLAILLMPLRTTPDWELGKSTSEIEFGWSVVRDTELKWAKRCLIAFVCEVTIVLIVVVVIKYGIAGPV